jgi:hypothetical protein
VKVIFCSDPLNLRLPDEAYQREVAAAQEAGLHFCLVDYEALTSGDGSAAVRRVAGEEKETLGVYRGWIITPAQYQTLYDRLLEKRIRLINDVVAYRHCHYLPESHSVIEQWTPKSVWLRCGPDVTFDDVMLSLRPFGSAPVIVKDYVKSRKHEWHEACYIPSVSDRNAVQRVVRKFIELQDEDFSEGLVFREFIEFEPLSQHSKSGMPLTKEFRCFFLRGRLMFWTKYWEEGNYQGVVPPLDQFTDVAGRVQSNFFTMDIAKRRDGQWMIVELGDAQVAGLPEDANAASFYREIAKAESLS